jgi:hypothetical protein
MIKTHAHHVDEGYFLLDFFTLTDVGMAFICLRRIFIWADGSCTT